MNPAIRLLLLLTEDVTTSGRNVQQNDTSSGFLCFLLNDSSFFVIIVIAGFGCLCGATGAQPPRIKAGTFSRRFYTRQEKTASIRDRKDDA